jgi:uncharacterized protein YecA (UPF0149 family)
VGLVGRNDKCPCGSGKKYKRCCIAREDELVRKVEAVVVALELPAFFPLLLPQDESSERWLAQHATPEPSSELIEQGIQQLPPHERRRMLAAYTDDFPKLWEGLVADAGDKELVAQAMVRGAVAVALAETREVDPNVLRAIEDFEQPRTDALETLSFAVDPTQLWSVLEANRAQRTIEDIPDWLDDEAYSQRWDKALGRQVSRSWSEAHERRLGLLTARIAAQLPIDDHANASAALAEGCALVVEDPSASRRLAEMLLGDAFDLLDEVQAAAFDMAA